MTRNGISRLTHTTVTEVGFNFIVFGFGVTAVTQTNEMKQKNRDEKHTGPQRDIYARCSLTCCYRNIACCFRNV